jgi:hypothetical protein
VPPTAATAAGPGPPVAPVRPGDAGFLSLELLVVAALLILVALLAVGWGRLSYSRGTVEKAAAAAARGRDRHLLPGAAAAAAQQTARADLAAAGISCATFTVSWTPRRSGPAGRSR